MQITISNEIIDRTEADGLIVSRIPKTNQYLYLEPESIITKGEYSIVAEIDPTKNYIVGEKDSNKPGSFVRGNALYKNYEYEKQYDPREQATQQQARKENAQQLIQQSKQTQEAKKEQSVKQVQQANAQKEIQQVQPVNAAQTGTAIYRAAQQSQEPNMQQKYSKEQFRQLKLGQKHHLDISQYWNINLSAEQMKQLRLMQENQVNIEKLGYNNPSVPAEVLNELRLGHKAGFEMNKYDWQHMSAKQLSEIRLGLEHGVDVGKYAFSAYSDAQMKQLRLGLQNGFDISTYRNPRFTPEQMYSMRCSQLFERIKEKFRNLFESVKRMFQESSLGQIRAKVMEKVSEGLGKTADMLTNENSMQFFVKQQAPVQTMDDRIQETVQDIKELLVSQELVPEEVLSNTEMSEQMNTRIKEALDQLMAPENIQNVANQEQIIEATAESVMQEAGVEFSSQELAKQKSALPEWNPNEMSDKELFDSIGKETELEEAIMKQEMTMTHAMEM